MNLPLRFEPFLRPMVWGGRRLGDVLGKTLPDAAAYGESWEVSDHAQHASVVANGPLKGTTLRDLMQTRRGDLLGPAADKYETFPWLVKFLDCNDWLSVQVHPDEAAVKWLWPSEGSKTEAWYVVHAEPGSRIYAGLRPGVGPAQLLAAVKAGTVIDCLASFEPQPGDGLLLKAGTVHAVGGGVLLAEIQQTSDATFRLFDWNRVDAQGKGRQLHVAESLACINWRAPGPVTPVRDPEVCPLVTCPYFRLERLDKDRPFSCGTGRLHVAVVLSGGGRWSFPGGEEEFTAGQTWVLPACLPRGECRPEGGNVALLAATLPE